MNKILEKILIRFTHWCEVYSKGVWFSDTRLGNFIYRNALDLQIKLQD